MNPEGASVSDPRNADAGDGGAREDLVRRVASSSTFEKSPRLRAFFLYVCGCALDNQPEAATEQQVGIHVFGRPAGYNPNEDNIVRSQARLLRMKLEHHFANEGKDERVVITIPKGRYVPVFEPRFERPVVLPGASAVAAEIKPRRRGLLPVALTLAAAFCIATVWLATSRLRPRSSAAPAAVSPASVGSRPEQEPSQPASAHTTAALPTTHDIRITAGNMGAPYVDASGRRWEMDRYYQGGVARPGPQHLFPPVADAGVFRTIREAASGENLAPESRREFRYDIPVHQGVYELRLYFADPLRPTGMDRRQDGQNERHFQVNCNGQPLLRAFDAIADAGFAPADVRVFRDIAAAADGKVHLAFVPGPDLPFLNALELTPGTPGKLKPIRICARPSDVVDSLGERWSADRYFINGRTSAYSNLDTGPKVTEPYTVERFGNFSYAIPVPPGSYTVKLHFLESFFTPLTGLCVGKGCRVFDVTCNGIALLEGFDVFEAAGGVFRPVIRTFHGLHPNGQGKLLLSFWSRVNYAEIRAIEVLDEAK